MLRDEPATYGADGIIKDHPYEILNSIPSHVQSNMKRNNWEAFLLLFPAVNRVCKAGNIPTPEAVLTVADPRTALFTNLGGKVEHALDFIIQCAQEQSCLGDNTWDELIEELHQEGSEHGLEYYGKPKCANDLEFELVRARLGAPRLPRTYTNYSDEDMDGEGSEDDDDYEGF